MSGAAFRWPLRVYYEDTDAAGIVFYASYLKFMERARTEWLRSRGFNHRDLRQEHGIVFVVARLDMRFHQPARLDDKLLVEANATKVGRASFDMTQSIFRDADKPLCAATVRLACLSTTGMRAVPIPPFLLTELKRED